VWQGKAGRYTLFSTLLLGMFPQSFKKNPSTFRIAATRRSGLAQSRRELRQTQTGHDQEPRNAKD